MGSVCDTSAGTNMDESSINSLMARHGLFAQQASLLVDNAALTNARSTFLLGEFEMLNLRVTQVDDGGDFDKNKSSSKSREVQQVIQNPNSVRAKRCGKRLKSSKEMAKNRYNRQCSVCGANGHDKRTCPKFNDRSNVPNLSESQYDNNNSEDVWRREDATFTSIACSSNRDGMNFTFVVNERCSSVRVEERYGRDRCRREIGSSVRGGRDSSGGRIERFQRSWVSVLERF
ncbi:Protein FAR1-RELATED SEQUENCE [Abeliophyllum distichum]|uniref:Protein FAR1-RELATED SEQUENCE n=1 Tax=Abeliophyllum distichum TaxID=126358 RepID=A0ABD1UJ22_9LAMI